MELQFWSLSPATAMVQTENISTNNEQITLRFCTDIRGAQRMRTTLVTPSLSCSSTSSSELFSLTLTWNRLAQIVVQTLTSPQDEL